VKVKFNTAAFDELRNSSEMQAVLRQQAERIAASAGPGFEVGEVFTGKKRARVTVRAATQEAREAEARDHNLLRALGQSE
jgi:hypothetical protein